ncbi:hypothetical protein [Saccharopolyspora gregorii]|uniref:Uncharacterized protein n=1 Tax=Saccharopolyspora gregorii TaxID=33914 RepID=A0ABP6RYQ0_9PSEU
MPFAVCGVNRTQPPNSQVRSEPLRSSSRNEPGSACARIVTAKSSAVQFDAETSPAGGFAAPAATA